MPNFYEILKLDPTQPYNENEFMQTLDRCIKLWERDQSHPSPQRREAAINNLTSVNEIKRIFANPELREQMCKEAVASLQAIKSERTPAVDSSKSPVAPPLSQKSPPQEEKEGKISTRQKAHYESFRMDETTFTIVCHYCKNVQDNEFASGTIMVKCEKCHREFEAHLLRVNARPELPERIPFVGTLSVKSPNNYNKDIYITINHNNMRYKKLLERLRAGHLICVTGPLSKPLNLIDYDTEPMYEAELNNGAANEKGCSSTLVTPLLMFFVPLIFIFGSCYLLYTVLQWMGSLH